MMKAESITYYLHLEIDHFYDILKQKLKRKELKFDVYNVKF